MKYTKLMIFVTGWFLILGLSCRSVRPGYSYQDVLTNDPVVLRLADSILQRGLDYEALYTIIGRIKPISSVATFSFDIANADSLSKHKGGVVDAIASKSALDSIRRLEQALHVINRLGVPDLTFILTPYRHTYGKERNMEIIAVRPSLLDSILKAQESFFGQFGFVPGASPGVVVNTIEFEDRYERLRGYGYLFGYPEYAVDFFVDAAYSSDRSGKFVERTFFQIPVYARDNGHFVYAMPKEHVPAVLDSALYFRAQEVLRSYKTIRSKYVRSDSTLRSIDLLKEIVFN